MSTHRGEQGNSPLASVQVKTNLEKHLFMSFNKLLFVSRVGRFNSCFMAA